MLRSPDLSRSMAMRAGAPSFRFVRLRLTADFVTFELTRTADEQLEHLGGVLRWQTLHRLMAPVDTVGIIRAQCVASWACW